MRSRSEIPDELKRDVAKVGSGIANAEPLRDFLKGYVEVAEMDFRLWNAPARFKTKLFRGALRLVNVLVATGEKINPELSPEFLNPLMVRQTGSRRWRRGRRRRSASLRRWSRWGGDRFWMDADPLPKMI